MKLFGSNDKDSARRLLDELLAEETTPEPKDGIALCLSGGGYRAMLFHLGAIIRLNELGVLGRLQRVSAVSGGAIIAGVLGLRWKQLFGSGNDRSSKLDELVVEPVRQMANVTIDRKSIILGSLLPGETSEILAKNYRQLFGNSTLRDLPDESEGPEFIFNATSVQTGSRVRMARRYLMNVNYHQALIPDPNLPLADVVAASSAFPPVLSPAELTVDPDDWVRQDIPRSQEELDEISQCARKLYLTDGGVYDNLGVDSAYKHCRTLLVSDGGGQKENEPIPDRDWIRHTIRILDLIDQQGRRQIKDQLLQSYKETIPAKRRLGTYWGIWSDLQNFVKSEASRNAPSQGFLEANFKDSLKLARVQTRLKSIDSSDQDKLINWGYAICDAAMRTHANDMILASHTTPTFPYAGGIA